MDGDGVHNLTVTIEVKTCSIEKCSDNLLKKFINLKYKDGIIVRDVAGVVIQGKSIIIAMFMR